MTTVLIAGGGTGGHLMPALAIGAAVNAIHPEWRVVYAGAQRGIEASVLPERGVPYHLLPLEPIYRREWWKNLRWPLLVPRLIREVNAMLDVERPDVVIGTGGYASGPVVWRAAARGIPTAILELDVRPGAATRLLATRVREVWVATADSVTALPTKAQARAIVTGAPITPPDPARRSAALAKFGLNPARPVVVVTGGSQGSLAVNRAVAEWLGVAAPSSLQVVWATGRGTYAEFAALHHPPAVSVFPFIDPMSDAWAIADLAVARSGMMTLSELCAWGIPSILVPLPTAAADHQTHNADAMARGGGALVIRQHDLTTATLNASIASLVDNSALRHQMADAARVRGVPDAAQALARRVSRLAGDTHSH